MKKTLLLFFTLLASLQFFALTPGDTIGLYTKLTPFNRKYDYQTWAIKARPIPYLLGNGLGATTLLGAELGFLKNNSIGLDGLFNGFHDIDDMPYEQDIYDKELAVHLNLDHYFNFQKLREKAEIVIYIGATGRTGFTNHREERSRSGDSVLSTHKDYFCYGAEAGVLFGPDSGPFSVNINIPVVYNMKTIYYTNSRHPEYNNIYNTSTVDWRFEINLCWWFKWRDQSIYDKNIWKRM
jgi:hypothetical protein